MDAPKTQVESESNNDSQMANSRSYSVNGRLVPENKSQLLNGKVNRKGKTFLFLFG